MKKLKEEQVEITIPILCDLRKTKLICFSDASFANLRDGSSQGGYIIFLLGEDNKYAPISWKSKKLKRIIRSTLAAETLALEETLEASFLLRSFLMEIINISEKEAIPIHCVVDNKSLIECIYSTKTITEKRLKIDICVIREMIERGEIKSVVWRESQLQLADCLTKTGASSNKLLMTLEGRNLIF